MRTKYLVVACGLVVACDGEQRAFEEQQLPLESKRVAVDPDPKPDPSIDNRNVPVIGGNTGGRIDLEEARSMLARSIKARTERLDASIDALERRGGPAAKDAVATLRAKRDQARAKMSELDNTTRETWVAFKRDVHAAWDELERDVDAATH